MAEDPFGTYLGLVFSCLDVIWNYTVLKRPRAFSHLPVMKRG
jgi:hypothetical protein